MFKKILLLFNGLLLISLCYGQNTASPIVMASGGGFFNADGYSLSFTYGELSVKTLTKSSYMLTEGFHQGKLHRTVSPYKEIRCFPNPVNHTPLHLDFNMDDGQSFIVQVFGIAGNTIGTFNYDNVMSGDRKDIYFTGVAKGLYLVKVQSKDGKILLTFKIERI